MKTELYSISKIFTERLLRIPDYQRGYAWTNKQLKDFWNDIEQIEVGHNHYVGVLTLEDVDKEKSESWRDDFWIIESKSYEPFFIVDGQQRLTTTVILIQCILESIGDHDLNYTSSSEIRKKFIYESKDGGISRSYLFGYEVDNPSYEFLKKEIFGEASDNQNTMQETIYTNNLKNAREFFLSRLKGKNIPEIELIYKKVTQNILFNIYSMSEEIDVHVSFETMNNRGKPLSHLELLKNRLIYLSTKVSSDDHEKRKLRDAINECWKTIYHQLGRNKDNPLDDDVFLFNHFILFFGDTINEGESINYRQLRRGYASNYKDYLLEEKFTTKSLYNDEDKALSVPELYRYVSSLKSSVEKWYEISNPKGTSLLPEISRWLEKINRMGVTECLPLIMVCLQKGYDESLEEKFLKSLEKLLFAFHFIGRVNFIDFNTSKFIEWASELSNEKTSLDKIVSEIEDVRAEIFSDSYMLTLVSDSFKDSGFYQWRGIRYFLFEYEQSLKEKSKNYTDKIEWEELLGDDRDHKTIEHIYPQNPRNQYWTMRYEKYTSKERTILRHSVGNLVPISQPKNSSFQNKPFPEKVGEPNSNIGFRYGSFSEIEVSNSSNWSAFEILNRGIKLLNFMEKRWGIEFGGLDKKVKFLNLGFVLEKEKLKIEGKSIKKVES